VQDCQDGDHILLLNEEHVVRELRKVCSANLVPNHPECQRALGDRVMGGLHSDQELVAEASAGALPGMPPVGINNVGFSFGRENKPHAPRRTRVFTSFHEEPVVCPRARRW
jgi:hypothetical protein